MENSRSFENGLDVIKDPHNRRLFVQGPPEELNQTIYRTSRESTASFIDDDDDEFDRTGSGRAEHQDDNEENWKKCDRLEIRFSHPPAAGSGFLFGTDKNKCDVVLPALHVRSNRRRPSQTPEFAISRKHFYITFDDQHRLIIRDCSSRGTIVTYNGQGGKKRRHFTWIIGGDQFPDKTETIMIEIHKHLKFQIIVMMPKNARTRRKNIDRMMQDTAASLYEFGGLGIESTVSTAVPSGAQTPHTDPILIQRQQIGKGAFSRVHLVWDVSTGLQYAAKEFNDIQKSDWQREAALLMRCQHVSVCDQPQNYHKLMPRTKGPYCSHRIPSGEIVSSARP